MTSIGTSTKRTASEADDDSGKPPCKFGSLCYRKNPAHLNEFSHQSRKANFSKGNTKASSAFSVKKPRATASLIPEPQHADAAFLQECYDMPTNPFQFPDDFFDLWGYCKELDPNNPREALVPLINYRLVGPFDALEMRGVVDVKNKRAFNLHSRYYYDPPEFQTLMVEVGTDNHLGYFRDDPNEFPVFVANSQLSRKEFHPWKLVIAGANLMQTVTLLLKERIKECPEDSEEKTTLADQLAKVSALSQNKHFVSYKSKRKTRALGSCLHHVGMVVPYDNKTEVGYRPLPMSNVELRKMMQQVENAPENSVKSALAPIQDLVTLVNFANDESDYGMGLELGLDLFLFGSPRLHGITLFLLENAYTLLHRPKFLEILKAHLEDRRKEDFEHLKVFALSELKEEAIVADQSIELQTGGVSEPVGSPIP